MKAHWSIRASSVMALLGMTIFTTVVEAQQPRSSIDRRQRPNGGFWESNSNARGSGGAAIRRATW